MNPLSLLFGAGVALRNTLYDRGIFKVRRLTRPVISIGNISVGGSGKTPFVITLGELLKQRGISFDVLSRGYGRSSTEIAVVDPLGSPQQFGDEPLLIARKLNVPVIVGADRYRAGLLAEEKFSSRLHLLDDGFQHRRLHRDFDIVLLPQADLNGTLLPAGRLRETRLSLDRAHAVVLFDTPVPDLKPQTINAKRMITLDGAGAKAFAFCGIARAGQFFESVRAQGVEIAGTRAFRDHIRYQQVDVDELVLAKQRSGADFFLTTEKDLINLGALAAQLQPLHTAQLRIELENADQALALILKAILTTDEQ
jgi:tetraacyldisaccharide 4'-kinase